MILRHWPKERPLRSMILNPRRISFALKPILLTDSRLMRLLRVNFKSRPQYVHAQSTTVVKAEAFPNTCRVSKLSAFSFHKSKHPVPPPLISAWRSSSTLRTRGQRAFRVTRLKPLFCRYLISLRIGGALSKRWFPLVARSVRLLAVGSGSREIPCDAVGEARHRE